MGLTMTIEIDTSPKARLEWALWVYCPKCSESNDLATPTHDAEYAIARYIFQNALDKLRGWEVTCEHCGHEFKISEVEY